MNIEDEYLEIIQRIKKEKQNLEDGDELLLILQKRANELFKEIRNTNELKLDAKFKKESHKIIFNKFKKKQNEEKLTSNSFLKLINKIEDDLFFKIVYSSYDKSLNLKIPKIFKEPFINKKRIKSKNEKIKEEYISPIIQSIPKYEEDIIDLMIKKIINIVKKEKKIEFFKLILNPNSFSKTIENIFYLSFANKTGEVKIYEENSIIFVKIETNISNLKIKDEYQHFIFNIQYYEYEKLISILNIKNSML